MHREIFMSRIKMIVWRVIPFVSLVTCNLAVTETLKEGAELGKWTMDFDEAIRLANTHNLPIMLNFTGSDWCGWCKIMQKYIFSKDEWSKFAAENLSLVTIDFPQDPTIVPNRFKERNFSLQQQFGVFGYPTYVLLESDGKTELGRLGASQNKDMASFQKQILDIVKYSKGNIEAYIDNLPPEKGREYKTLVTQLNDTQSELETWLKSRPAESEENFTKFASYMSKMTKLSVKIDAIKAEQFAKGLAPEKAEEYLALSTKLNETRIELDNWLISRPEANDVNRQKKEDLETEIEHLKSKIDQF